MVIELMSPASRGGVSVIDPGSGRCPLAFRSWDGAGQPGRDAPGSIFGVEAAVRLCMGGIRRVRCPSGDRATPSWSGGGPARGPTRRRKDIFGHLGPLIPLEGTLPSKGWLEVQGDLISDDAAGI